DHSTFRFCASAPEAVWGDAATRAVIIATRNGSHAALIQQALAAGKAVFVEKPLCMSGDELAAIVEAYERADLSGRLVTVGFNRRFSPAAGAVRAFLEPAGSPLMLQYRINAGRLPDGSWVTDPEEGGGRIISEACHFVDLAAFLLGAAPVSV